MSKDEPIFPISVASKLLGLHPRTLRIYEEEGLIKPARIGQKRYFSHNDLEWIKCLRQLIHEEGISIPGIKKLLTLSPCWEIKNCPEEVRAQCSAYQDRTIPCWQRTKTACARRFQGCQTCEVYLRDIEKLSESAEDE
ncbi:MerR family transcriptional regulator [Thermosulfuriphilus ammonigenes]|uniref:MerR family transcriptional regulator n=1 Tax=Thermosulfuriphilus ammonigenes TaxID=1936021 RepID=A0A6G7PZK7_9BACT|nr:MerR family transcriptional regulator [Thermosulfuriphilus ammonigenes]